MHDAKNLCNTAYLLFAVKEETARPTHNSNDCVQFKYYYYDGDFVHNNIILTRLTFPHVKAKSENKQQILHEKSMLNVVLSLAHGVWYFFTKTFGCVVVEVQS